MRKVIWSTVALLYAALVTVSYVLQINLLLFFLTIPWSCIVSFFAMLLVHMFSYQLNDYLLVGAVINFGLIVRAAIEDAHMTNI